MRKLFLSALMLLPSLMVLAQTEIKVQTHNVVEVDEQFNITFIIEGDAKASDFSWEPGADFQVLWGPQQGRSTSVQMINGKTTRTVQATYSYVMRSNKAGKFTINKASAKVKGKEIYSKPVSIEVVSSGAKSSQSQAGRGNGASQGAGGRSSVTDISNEDLFLTLEMDRTNVVVGEPITASIKLYQRVNIAGFESAEFPDFNGFWSQEIEAPTNIEFARETYNGQIYNSALLRKFILIPQQQGTVIVDPAELVCVINIRVSSPGTSIFDGFFDDYRTIRKRVATKPVKVNVSALPSGAPASFAGGVGSFKISAKLAKDSLKTHEAGSLLISISGKGNVSLLETPKVVFPADMEVYDTKVSEKIEKGGLSGTKYYEYPFIARSYGDFIIEPVKYSYYDVNQKKYVTLETPAIPVSVEKGSDFETGTVVVGTGSVAKDVKTLASDVRYINTKSSSLVPKGRFLVGSAIFWILLALVFVLAFTAWLLFRGMAARRADVVGTKNRKATKMALKRLQLANSFLKQNLYTAFYEELHKALLGFISDKLNIASVDLSRDRITDSLRKGAVDEKLIETFIGILDACEFARYAPDSGNEAMTSHYQSAVDVISSIDTCMKSSKSSKTPKSAALMLVMLIALPFAASASTQQIYVDSLWNSANQAYAEARWADAIEDYDMISSMGLESPALYCNTGNAYFKDMNIPKAILYYERALKLDPSYKDARYNLDLLNGSIQDRIDPVPEFVLKAWMRDICYLMDSNAWTVCFIVFLAVTLAMFLLFVLGSSAASRRTGFFTAIVLLIISAFSLGFGIWQKKDYMKVDAAIVMRPVTTAKSSPSGGEASKDLFVLHEGTKLKIIDAVGQWNNIELADGRQGWLPSSDIEVI